MEVEKYGGIQNKIRKWCERTLKKRFYQCLLDTNRSKDASKTE